MPTPRSLSSKPQMYALALQTTKTNQRNLMVTYVPNFPLSASFWPLHLPRGRFLLLKKKATGESKAPHVHVANATPGAQQVGEDGLLRFH